MHITVERSELITVLKRASGAFVKDEDNKPVEMKPYMMSVLIMAGEAGLAMRSVGAQLQLLCQVTGSVKKPGRALLNYQALSSRVTELPPGLVEIIVNDKFQVTVRSTSSKRKFTMQAYEPELFPKVLDSVAERHLYSIEAKILRQASDEVIGGIEKSLCDAAVLLPGEGKRFRMMTAGRGTFAVATAWFAESDLGNAAEEALLPRHLLLAARSLPQDSSIVVVLDGNNHVALKTDLMTIVCSKVQTPFPSAWRGWLDYALQQKRFRVSSEAFLGSVRAVSVAAEQEGAKDRFVQIEIGYRNGDCMISTLKSDTNYGEDELVVSDPSETSCRIYMSEELLRQALRTFVPAEIDVFYEVALGQETLLLQNENLFWALSPLAVIHPKGAP